MTANPSNTELKRPNRPQVETADSQTSQAKCGALALSTSAVHGLRTSLTGQVGRIEGIVESYQAATSEIVDETSDFLAAAISGELLWHQITERTKAKLAHMPKQEVADLTPKKLKPLSWRVSEVKPNRYLSSTATAFPDGSTHLLP